MASVDPEGMQLCEGTSLLGDDATEAADAPPPLCFKFQNWARIPTSPTFPYMIGGTSQCFLPLSPLPTVSVFTSCPGDRGWSGGRGGSGSGGGFSGGSRASLATIDRLCGEPG